MCLSVWPLRVQLLKIKTFVFTLIPGNHCVDYSDTGTSQLNVPTTGLFFVSLRRVILTSNGIDTGYNIPAMK